MKRTIPFVLLITLCLSLALFSAPAGTSVATAQASNTRTYTESYLKGLALTGGYYSCLKQQAPYTFFWQDWYGVKLSYLLDNVIGLAAGTQLIRVHAVDGMTVDLTLDRMRNPNSQGLYTILAWQTGVQGAPHKEPPLTPLSEAEDGIFRLALGQSPKVGDYASGGTPNFNDFEKWVRTIEVLPLPAGVAEVNPATVPAGQIVVYGNIGVVTNPCGGGASLAIGLAGVMMGLLAIAGGGAAWRKKRRNSK